MTANALGEAVERRPDTDGEPATAVVEAWIRGGKRRLGSGR